MDIRANANLVNASKARPHVAPPEAITRNSSDKLQQDQQQVASRLRAEAAKAGANANVSIQYQYTVGPDGQLYVSGGTVSSSERVVRDAKGQELEAYAPILPPLANESASGRLKLSPEAFAESFGLNDQERTQLRELQNRDAEVRIHEAQHFRAAGGLAKGTPNYTYQQGPDGQFYAVGGNVQLQTSRGSDPEQAKRDAQSFSNAAQAPGDASAQDISVARDALSNAAALYRAQSIDDSQGNQPGLQI